MPGARCTRSLVCKGRKHTSSHHRFTGQTGVSCAMVLRLIPRSPWRPGFLATIAPKKLASRELDASVGASGPHGFSVRKKALSSLAPLASIASQPYVRDDRETPLCVGRDGEG